MFSARLAKQLWLHNQDGKSQLVKCIVLFFDAVKAIIRSDMSAQTAVLHFMSEKEIAIAVEMFVFADVAHLKLMKLESGPEDAITVHIAQMSSLAALAVVNAVKVAADRGHVEMISGEIAALAIDQCFSNLIILKLIF